MGEPKHADQLLTIAEVAARLATSRSSVYDLFATGRLERVNIGTARKPRLRVKESALMRYIERSTLLPVPARTMNRPPALRHHRQYVNRGTVHQPRAPRREGDGAPGRPPGVPDSYEIREGRGQDLSAQ
ncbi:helix-turn-helix domain-containing protein [Dactylosporangium darangshiense]|uniref:Helix-turn-helix domain-containing protein n=1 Tax=Dactylosporangium darangshiense TaxID=579108 RepID=A0ABP8CTB6_9ACTN